MADKRPISSPRRKTVVRSRAGAAALRKPREAGVKAEAPTTCPQAAVDGDSRAANARAQGLRASIRARASTRQRDDGARPLGSQPAPRTHWPALRRNRLRRRPITAITRRSISTTRACSPRRTRPFRIRPAFPPADGLCRRVGNRREVRVSTRPDAFIGDAPNDRLATIPSAARTRPTTSGY